jgi:hypothetical protein
MLEQSCQLLSVEKLDKNIDRGPKDILTKAEKNIKGGTK